MGVFGGQTCFLLVEFLTLALQEEVVHVPKVMTATRQVQQHVETVVEVPIHQSLGPVHYCSGWADVILGGMKDVGFGGPSGGPHCFF